MVAAGQWFYIYGSGVLLAMSAVFLTEMSFPNQQRSAEFFRWTAATYPLYLLGLARASKSRWGATWIALVYMLVTAVMAWILPLFAGEPKLGPITNRVEKFVALSGSPRGAGPGHRPYPLLDWPGTELVARCPDH